MDRTGRRTAPWVAFFAGAVAMLAVALAWAAFRQRDEASQALRLAAEAVEVAPALQRPRLPDAPRIPDTPVPRPQ
ncbi:hypothetical protein ACO2Q0_03520 [Phenylobacterium sp. VNQ135]|uniref:hypothetical protein n=1 Tax=Phenylobacterium sp. VNQ135 TaxID=3400922 RepID=UPI003BFD694F